MRFQVHRGDCAIDDGHQNQMRTKAGKDFDKVHRGGETGGSIGDKDERKGQKQAHGTAGQQQQQFTEVSSLREFQIQHSLSFTSETVEDIGGTVE